MNTTDQRETYAHDNPDIRVQREAFDVRLGYFKNILEGVLPGSMKAVTSHHTLMLGGATVRGHEMFDGSGHVSRRRSLLTMPTNQPAPTNQPPRQEEAVVFNQPAIRPEFRGVEEPIEALRNVDPNSVPAIDANAVRESIQTIRDASNNTPELKLPQ